MTDRKSRRVVIINNIDSETIDQAIFILKSDKKDISLQKGKDTDVVREAQNIINSYVRQVERQRVNITDKNTVRKKRKRGFKPVTAIMSVLFCLAVCFILFGYIIN